MNKFKFIISIFLMAVVLVVNSVMAEDGSMGKSRRHEPNVVQFELPELTNGDGVVAMGHGCFGWVIRKHIDFTASNWPEQVMRLNKHFWNLNAALYPYQFYTLIALAILGLVWPLSFLIRKGVNKR